MAYPLLYENTRTNAEIFYSLFAPEYLLNSINSYLKISLLLVNIYNNTDCQQRQNIVVALYLVVISMHFRSILKVMLQNGNIFGVAKISFFFFLRGGGGGLKFLIFLG